MAEDGDSADHGIYASTKTALTTFLAGGGASAEAGIPAHAGVLNSRVKHPQTTPSHTSHRVNQRLITRLGGHSSEDRCGTTCSPPQRKVQHTNQAFALPSLPVFQCVSCPHVLPSLCGARCHGERACTMLRGGGGRGRPRKNSTGPPPAPARSSSVGQATATGEADPPHTEHTVHLKATSEEATLRCSWIERTQPLAMAISTRSQSMGKC